MQRNIYGICEYYNCECLHFFFLTHYLLSNHAVLCEANMCLL